LIKRIIIILFIFYPLLTFGQVYIGARVGYGVSSVEFVPTQKEKSLFDDGLDAGISIKFFDLQYVGFQGDLSVTRRGYRKPFEDTLTYKRINSYIELPIYMQVRMENKGLFIHLNAGCYGAFLLNSVEGDNRTGSYIMQNYEFNILRDKRFDYGLIGTAGVGYETPLGVFQIDFRFTWGLGDLYNHEYEGTPGRSPSRIQNLSFSYYWNISKQRKNRENIIRENKKIDDILDE
jgi:hypothetical protein